MAAAGSAGQQLTSLLWFMAESPIQSPMQMPYLELAECSFCGFYVLWKGPFLVALTSGLYIDLSIRLVVSSYSALAGLQS